MNIKKRHLKSNQLQISQFFIQIIILIILISSPSCVQDNRVKSEFPFASEKNPWTEIRKERIQTLLPEAMKNAEVNTWIVLCRENNNDPLANHIGGENAGGTAAFIFNRSEESFEAVAITPEGEATALIEMGNHDRYLIIKKGEDIWQLIKEELLRINPEKIAINSSQLSIADGLSFNQRTQLEDAIGSDLASRIIPSENLVMEWLSVKLPKEIEIMRQAALLTEQLQIEAYQKIIPGETKDSDLAKYIKNRMIELGVEDAWAPDQNPNINSGADRGHSHSTDKVIQPGDFIQTDFGIKVYGIWCTDIQRFAYVLKPGEKKASVEATLKFENAKKGSRIALKSMKPGVRGYDVDLAQRKWMEKSGSLDVIWGTGHPVGYWAHDAGPALSGAQKGREPRGNSLRILRPGQVFAYDGFYSWPLAGSDSLTKTISVEEMAVVTKDGAEYLIKPQDELVLIAQ